jgi:polyisoprenoid-binding protein YceI
MKRTALNLVVILIGFLFAAPVFAQQAYQVKNHSIIVKGTSNLHDWTANAEKANGNFNVVVNDGKIAAVNAVDLKVDAKSLKGSKGNIMDKKIAEALNANKNQYISFKSTGGTVTEKSGTYKVTANGILTIAGNSQRVTIDALGKVMPNGDIEFTGTKKLRMTDYKVDPPTAMLGTLTTGDEVILQFKVVLGDSNNLTINQ